MLSVFTNLTKAAAGLVVAPFAIVADLCTLPSSAYDGRPAFGKTAAVLKLAGQAADAAVSPPKEGKQE